MVQRAGNGLVVQCQQEHTSPDEEEINAYIILAVLVNDELCNNLR